MKKLLFILLLGVSTGFLQAQVCLPKLINNGMVLQRDAEVKIWGWASAGEAVSVSFLDKLYETKAGKNGKWDISLANLKAGGPYKMNITGKNNIRLEEVYVGDVWLASGQSNMELPMYRVEPLYEEEVATASNPHIRFFQVPQTYNFNEPKQDLEGGKWLPVTPENIRQFSAVAYFFAKNLNERYKVPVGIINSSLGGSPAEAWISEESLKKFPHYLEEAARYKSAEFRDSIEKSDSERIGDWYKKSTKEDIGIKENWKGEDTKVSDWGKMQIPGYWADNELGLKNGVVWFRRKFEIPEKLTNQSPKLLLGRIVDADSVFVNGEFVGNTTYQYPPRRYNIPADVLNPGENTISIRVINEGGRGGFVEDKPYKLVFQDSEIDLAGEWNYKLGVEMPPLKGQTFIRWKPVGLYNAMINPLTNYSLKGVIWYQGESNTDTAAEYEELFSTLIRDWRKKWKQENLPFLFVQLANFMESKEKPGDSNWARLRDAQLKTLSLPETGMAVTIDVGEWNDIHPLNKKTVGDRLAQAARKIAYDEEVVAGGPVYNSYTRKGNSIVIDFKNVGKGLMIKNGSKLKQFAIAGKDHKFVWANAKIQGDKIIVSSPEVENPVAVRYAWADNPEGANLYNKAGFPASPFRTDSLE
ncbi:sialate O-acetylesterase [Zunongwangia sp. F363]|uniref:Sialate O-acetylesterase n=1 Tax=Autumnicola tepida TaxID=3075595 RepID=A0ABU3CBI9_9FLAO|nr:sialate O-acetylesterase [Zunongwangia sp. F363]MDT0643572.1 sialate O-acetylesterase [Zunongwangia sp. F363]